MSSSKSVIRERMKKRAAGNGNTTSLSTAQGPCDHPTVVGGLCVVCGADTRLINGSSQTNKSSGDWLSTRKSSAAAKPKPLPKEPLHIPRKIPRKDNIDIRQQKILDRQKNIAKSLATAAELDEEMAAIDMDSLQIPKKKAASTAPAAVPKQAIKNPTPSTGFRSLSSLLSGAMATQKMQQTQGRTSSIKNNPRSVPRRNKYASNNPSQYNSTDPKMTQMTVSGGVTLTVSESEAKAISAASAKKLTEEKKLCLVLDLDHTLLHATDDYRASRFVADEIIANDGDDEKKIDEKSSPKTMKNDQKRDDVRTILLPMELPPDQQEQYAQQKFQQRDQQKVKVHGLEPLPVQNANDNSVTIMRHYIKLRPHLKEFLTTIQSTYQLSVYTAGTRAYAEQVAIMICRHLVGATLDEEGVNTLRARLREKDVECRRYEAYAARQKQLSLAKERDMKSKDEAKSKGPKKAVKFDHSKEEDEARKATIDLIVIDDSDDDSYDGEHTSSGKRSAADIDNDVPRKKKKSVNFGRLPTSSQSSTDPNAGAMDDKKVIDPTEERNRLRVQLEEAEKLEIKAVQLRRKLFGSRIVSRTDVGDLGKDVKSLKRVFPCGGVMAAILDDREDVWANAKNNDTGRPGEPPDNLLLVKPYHWKPFQGYADVNNASGQDLSESDAKKKDDNNDGKDDDQMLLWTADILRRLHDRYYSTPSSVIKSVPDLLRSMRRETLRRHPSAKVVLSGLIPIHKQNIQSTRRPAIVRYAEELGAEILPDVARGVTHVVAARDGSSKIRRARTEFPGCYVVHTAWLMECYWSITRRDETKHHMGPMPKQPTKPPLSGTSDLLLGGNEEESDVDEIDDDFAAALENDMMEL